MTDGEAPDLSDAQCTAAAAPKPVDCRVRELLAEAPEDNLDSDGLDTVSPAPACACGVRCVAVTCAFGGRHLRNKHTARLASVLFLEIKQTDVPRAGVENQFQDGYKLNGAFKFDVDRGESLAMLEPTSELLA
eukprot:829353-Rhodomonas_salina.2